MKKLITILAALAILASGTVNAQVAEKLTAHRLDRPWTFSSFVAPSGCVSTSVPFFGASVTLGCDGGITYDAATDKLSVGALRVGTSTTAGWVLTADADGNGTWAAGGATNPITVTTVRATAPATLTITGSTNATPIVVTATGHGLVTGDNVRISGITGNTNANGYFKITRLTADTFSLQNWSTGADIAGNGTHGGTPVATAGVVQANLLWTPSYNVSPAGTTKNVLIGGAAGAGLTTATEVTAVGDLSANAAVGAYSTAVGSGSLRVATSTANTAVGRNSLSSLTTGATNTALGASAGAGVTTSTLGLFLGYNTTYAGSALYDNSTVIGSNASGTASDQITLGDAVVDTVKAGSGAQASFKGKSVRVISALMDESIRDATTETLTLSTSGATTATTLKLIPARARINAIHYRISTAITTATSFTIKPTGGNDFVSIGTATAAQSTLTLGTTGVLVPAALSDQYAAAANTLTVTAAGGIPGAGALQLTVHYDQFVSTPSWLMVLGDSKSIRTRNWSHNLTRSIENRNGGDWTEYNGAVGGQTVVTGAAALPAVLTSWPTDTAAGAYQIALLNWGANDTATSETNFKNSLTSVIDQVHTKAPAAKIYIMYPWRRGYDAQCASMHTWIDAVIATRSAYAYAGPDEAVWMKGADDGATMTSDGTHYSAAGEAEAVVQWLTVLGY